MAMVKQIMPLHVALKIVYIATQLPEWSMLLQVALRTGHLTQNLQIRASVQYG